MGFTMTGVLSFLCLLCFVSLCITTVSSTPFAYHCQNTTTYTPNSTYEANLNVLLSVLSSNATRINGFYNFTSGRHSPDVVHGLFLCRGDVSTVDCHDCVVTARDEIVQYCPKEKVAIVYYDNCLLRYSNQSIYSILDYSAPIEMHNPLNLSESTDPRRFRQVLGEIMDDVASRAANDQSGKKFATKEANLTALKKLYGLAQCTPDLSGADCKSCLRDAISSLPTCCDRKQGGRFLFPSCNVRYELYAFYNANATAAPILPPGPARSPGKWGISSQVLVVIIVAAVVFVLLYAVGFCFLRRKAKMKYDALQEDFVGNETKAVQSLQYDLITIQAATSNFSDDNKIGEGVFGNVYRGTLPKGQKIAVKRLSRNSGQNAEEFKNEVVMVAKLQHKNLVKLLGFCFEGEEKILIYEFVTKKSLEHFLFEPEKHENLDWSKRNKIIRGIARGIIYLHEDSGVGTIHPDLKPINILLDGDMNAKISDFGMTRIFGMDQTQVNTSRVVGTCGYMPSEYVICEQFSVKSDVFSFGVLVLEIISGNKNNSFYQSDCAENIMSYAWKLWRDGTPLELMDTNLEGSYSRSEVTRFIHIGLLCVQEDLDARPSMATVVLMLNSDSIPLAVPKQPAILASTKTGSNTPNGLESDESPTK